MVKSKKNEKIDNKIKHRGLFDHVTHIRETKNPDYYRSLSEEERKSFNKFMILRILSMDRSIIEEVAYISKYTEIIPDEQFYKLLIDVVPNEKKYCKYIKKSDKDINELILGCLCKRYEIGKKDAVDYYKILMSYDDGIRELTSLISTYGYSEKEIETMFKVG